MNPSPDGPGKPQRRYGTILADPPWDILQKGNRGAERHYPLLSTKEIASLPVERLAADDAHLWLWVTYGSLLAGHTVLEAWGFTLHSRLTWTKPESGLAHHARVDTEFVLLGIRGKAPSEFRAQGSCLTAPPEKYNCKPKQQYTVVERCSPGPYLELFARRRRPGWHAWGNQVHSDVAL